MGGEQFLVEVGVAIGMIASAANHGAQNAGLGF
jgi:hypothetical protein